MVRSSFEGGSIVVRMVIFSFRGLYRYGRGFSVEKIGEKWLVWRCEVRFLSILIH